MHTVTEMLVNVLSLKSEDDEDDLGVEEDENVLAGSGEQVCGGRRGGGLISHRYSFHRSMIHLV